MEDYDIFNEMQNLNQKKVVMLIEDDQDYIIKNLFTSDIEIMPIRLSYDLSSFSEEYIDKTKKLFTYYFNKDNKYDNELLRLKKHFIHYQRFPFIVYIPKKFKNLIKMFNDLKIECVNDKDLFLKKIQNDKKLILLDTDGTIRRTDWTISDETKLAIKKAQENGYIIVICTSRPRYNAIEIKNETGASDIVISSNGSEIFDTSDNKIISNLYINKKDIYELINYSYLYNVRLVLTSLDTDYVTNFKRNEKQIIIDKNNYVTQLKDVNIKQAMFIDKNKEGINKLKKIINENKTLKIVDEINKNDKKIEKWFSIGVNEASKGNALVTLSNYLSIPLKNTIAIGNDKNDISMIEKANLGVAVLNADEEVKNIANKIIGTNDEDAVAKFLMELIDKD